MARTFTTSSQGWFRLTASGLAVPGRGPGRDPQQAHAGPQEHARGDGQLDLGVAAEPGGRPTCCGAIIRARGSPAGPKPVIRLTWRGRRTIRRMVIQPLPGFAAAPEAIKITSPQGTRYASIGLDGLTEIVPPLTTSQMTISFPVVQYAASAQPARARSSSCRSGCRSCRSRPGRPAYRDPRAGHQVRAAVRLRAGRDGSTVTRSGRRSPARWAGSSGSSRSTSGCAGRARRFSSRLAGTG